MDRWVSVVVQLMRLWGWVANGNRGWLGGTMPMAAEQRVAVPVAKEFCAKA